MSGTLQKTQSRFKINLSYDHVDEVGQKTGKCEDIIVILIVNYATRSYEIINASGTEYESASADHEFSFNKKYENSVKGIEYHRLLLRAIGLALDTATEELNLKKPPIDQPKAGDIFNYKNEPILCTKQE